MSRLCAAALVAALAAQAPSPAARATLHALNRVRAAHGLHVLRRDPCLARAARAHSREMVKRRYFAHRSAAGAGLVARIARTGWLRHRRRWHVAENLAWGTGRLATPAAVVRAWMASPPHRRHILAPDLRVAGIGVVRGTPFTADGATYTADFGSG
jgi:uncharacterized protein YkwD